MASAAVHLMFACRQAEARSRVAASGVGVSNGRNRARTAKAAAIKDASELLPAKTAVTIWFVDQDVVVSGAAAFSPATGCAAIGRTPVTSAAKAACNAAVAASYSLV